MAAIWNFLDGKKAYLVALGVCLNALLAWYGGDLSVQEAVNQALVGMGIGAIRHGVSKV